MKSNKTEKKFPAPEFPDKPTMEVAWQGVPLTWEVDPDSPIHEHRRVDFRDREQSHDVQLLSRLSRDHANSSGIP